MKPDLFSIIMYPSVPFNTEEALGKILDVFESNDKFAPNHWGNSELVKVEYNRDEIIEKVIVEKSVSELHLSRDKAVKFSGFFNIHWSHRAFFNFDFHKSMTKKMWPAFFELSDQLAEVLKPIFGVTHISWPSTYLWNNEKERMKIWMDVCSYPVPVRFIPNGPLGVGARTYIGGHILDMFGKDFLLNSPGVVREPAWGGVCLDVAPKPFEADDESLLASWLPVMEYLEAAQVIAIPHFDEDRMGVSFSPNQAWVKYLDS